MIRKVEISHFRCFRSLTLNNVARINLIVGDNGSGKTTLLEAIFLTLATSTQILERLRQQRGWSGLFSGTPRSLEDAIWGDFFYRLNYNEPIRVMLEGDGPETRIFMMWRDEDRAGTRAGPLKVSYQNSFGETSVFPVGVGASGPVHHETGESLPHFLYFPAHSATGSVEVADRFSAISRARKQKEFVELFANEYGWLEDISIEVNAGSPALYGTVKGQTDRIGLPSVSGGINRTVSILAGIAARERSIVLVDEIENGIYYAHQKAIWVGLLKALRERDGQLIATTHSKEWLEALIGAAGDDVDDIALWRVEAGDDQPIVTRFGGDTLKAGIEYGVEIRADEE